MNTAPTVPAYLTSDGGAVYVEELQPLKGIRFFNARCYSPDGEEYAHFPSVAEGTLEMTAKALGWTKNEDSPQSMQSMQAGRAQNLGSRQSAAYLGCAHGARVWPDEDGWKLTLDMVDGNSYVMNIHGVAEELLDQMVQVQDWLVQS